MKFMLGAGEILACSWPAWTHVQILPVEQNRKCHLEHVLHHSFPVWREQTGQGEEYSIHLQPPASLEIRLKEFFVMTFF